VIRVVSGDQGKRRGQDSYGVYLEGKGRIGEWYLNCFHKKRKKGGDTLTD